MKFGHIFALAIMIILLSVFLLQWNNRPVAAVASSGVSADLQNSAASSTTPSTTTQTFCGSYCTVTFTELGLPSGIDWQVTFGNTVQRGTSSTMSFPYVLPGNYSWSIQSPITGINLTRYEASQPSGIMDVPAQSSVSIKFVTQYQVSFYVSPTVDGWTSPSGTLWYNSTAPLSINATAFSGYDFVSWNSSNGISIANMTVANTIAQLNSGGSIVADFEVANTTNSSSITTTSTNSTLASSSSTSTSTTSVFSTVSSASSASEVTTTNITTSSATNTTTLTFNTSKVNSTTTAASSSSNATTTIKPEKSINIAALFYTVPYVTTQSPSLLGTLIFVTEVGSATALLLVIRKSASKKKEDGVDDSTNWGWRW